MERDAKKAIRPDVNDYLYLNGEANLVLKGLIKSLSLDSLFAVSDDDSGIVFHNYQVPLQEYLLTGFTDALERYSGRVEIKYISGEANGKFDVSDYDDNAATQSSVTFKIDTVPPTLNVTAPTDKLVTKNTACPVKGNTNDITSSPVSLKVNGTTATVNADGTFSTTVNLVEGSNTITIVATDSAGKSTTVTRQVTLDTKAPVIKSASLSKSTCTTGESITILIEVED